MEDIGMDFSGCDGGLSFGGDLNFQSDIGIPSETCFQDGGEFSFQQPEMGQLQFPNRLGRQLVQSRAPRTNHGGVVLAAGLPVQTVRPAHQVLHSSMTNINNPGYQVQPGFQIQPGYHAQPVNIQQPLGAAVIFTNNGFPAQSVQATHQVTVVNTRMPVQRPGPVVGLRCVLQTGWDCLSFL